MVTAEPCGGGEHCPGPKTTSIGARLAVPSLRPRLPGARRGTPEFAVGPAPSLTHQTNSFWFGIGGHLENQRDVHLFNLHDIASKRIMLRLLTQESFLRIERRPAGSTALNKRWLRGII